MKRRFTSEESSLELLLDTICNTFGGILFISLLVVIILNTTSESAVHSPPSQAAQASMIQASIERDELTQELDRLKAAVSQQRTVAGSVISDDVVRLAKQVKEQQANYDGALIDKSKAVGNLTQAQASINQLTQDAADIKSKLNDAQEKWAALQHVLDQKVAAKSRTAPMPKVRHAGVDESVYFLKGGKLFGPYLQNGVPNATDFIEVQQNGDTVLDVKPTGGVGVDADGNNTDELVVKFHGLNPKVYGAKVFAWPDSYVHFDAVRLALGEVDLGYELIPVDDNAVIKFGQAGGSGMSLQ